MIPEDALPLADGRYLLPNGEIVDPKVEKQQEVIVIPKPSEATAIVAKTKRTLAELPAIPQKMNVINVVLIYTMYGLSDEEIALATELTTLQIKRIKEDDAYKSASQMAREAVLNTEATEVRDILAAGATQAARRVVQDIGAKGGAGFAAAKDVLDRTGHSASNKTIDDMVKRGGLMIQIIKKSAADHDITIKLGETDG